MRALSNKRSSVRTSPPQGRLRVIVRRALYVKGCIVIVLAAVLMLAFLRLAAGPVSLLSYAGEVTDALAERLGPGWTVTVEDAGLELSGLNPAVRTAGIEIRNPAGVAVVRAPHATVSLDPLSLLAGNVVPRELELQRLQLRGQLGSDGSLSFAAAADPITVRPPAAPLPAAPAGPGPVPPGEGPKPSVVAAAVASLLDPVVGATGVVSALDRASIRDASLTLVGPDGRERAAFPSVGAVFERLDGGDRRIEIELEGERGAWRVQGRVRGGPDRAAEIEAESVPVGDILLFTGLSAVPAGTDLKLTGRLSTEFKAGRLVQLEGRLDTSPGTIRRAVGPPIAVESASLQASWDEAATTLNLPVISVRSEGTNVQLAARMEGQAGQPWRLSLGATDVRFAGLTPRDGDFRLDTVQVEVSLAETGLTLTRGIVRGEAVAIDAAGTLEPGPAGPTLKGTLEVRNTSARRLVRLWPDFLNPKLRGFLAQKVARSTVESLRLRSVLDPQDMKAAFSEAPISDGAIDLKFASTGGELAAIDGAPPIRNLAVEGRATGTTANLKARDGIIEMPDGRRIGATDGSFVHLTLDRPNTPAQVAFRLVGGVDALASLLASPAFRDAGAVNLDPATLHGQADIRVRLPLVPGTIPPVSELALSIAGNLTDVSADKLPGKERLEGGSFALTGEGGALSVRGEGRLSGTPATFEMASPKPGAGEIAVSLVMDDAGRTRRSLPAGPLLAGPIPTKAVIGLANHSVRVEADLTRAAIDGLVPGWVKPAGKPGRLSFTLADPEAGELRDFSVDAGPTQIRGQLTLSAGNGLERADLPTFKLSPGDDVRAQLERGPSGGYRVSIKGNNADARPLLRWATQPGREGRPASREGGRDGPGREDVDLDLAVNILSGFNDEALTGVSAKLSGRGTELKALQFTGRFRAALLEAQLARRDAGAPMMSVRSGDAGATLRFFDLYRRLVGGTLVVDGRAGEGVQEGRVVIDEFGLRNEPALARIVSQATSASTQPGSDERGGLAPVARGDLDQVLFNRLSGTFRHAGSRTDYTDIVIYGSQVGFNLAGWVDSGRDRLDVAGTFVPAYLLNNAFSQLPVVGLLLGGGRNEGLFAVDFRVVGPVANPALTVNPLTVVAPGILRKLFGWMLEGPEPAGETPAASSSIGERRTRRP